MCRSLSCVRFPGLPYSYFIFLIFLLFSSVISEFLLFFSFVICFSGRIFLVLSFYLGYSVCCSLFSLMGGASSLSRTGLGLPTFLFVYFFNFVMLIIFFAFNIFLLYCLFVVSFIIYIILLRLIGSSTCCVAMRNLISHVVGCVH